MINRRLLCLDTPPEPAGPIGLDLSRRLREPQTRRWFLKAGMSIGAIAALQIWPNFEARAAGSTWFVSSVSGDNSTGVSWATAKTTITAGIALAAAGDVILVDKAHAATATAAITYTPPAGTLAIISVTPSGAASFSAYTAGAAESVGAASALFAIATAANSAMFLYGLTLNGGTNSSSSCDITFLSTLTTSGPASLEMWSCTFDLKAAATGANINFGLAVSSTPKAGYIRTKDCTFICSGSRAATFMLLGDAKVDMINPTFSITGGTKPVVLVGAIAVANTAQLLIKDGDLSGFNVTASAYFDVATLGGNSVVEVKNCKLGSTPTLTSGTWPQGNGSILVRNSDSADTINVFTYVTAYGTMTADASIYVTTGGSQFNGAGVSWKIVTTSLATEYTPFVTPQLALWGTTTTAETMAIEFLQDNAAAALTDLQIWADVDTAASTSFPNYNYATDRNATPFTGSGSAQPTSTTAWTGSLTNPTKQVLNISVTPAEVGLITGRVKVAAASKTIYMNAGIAGLT